MKVDINKVFHQFLKDKNVNVYFAANWKKEYTGPIKNPKDYIDTAFTWEDTDEPELWAEINELWLQRLMELGIY